MKRTFCLLAKMAFLAISSASTFAHAANEKSALKKVQLEFIQDYVEEAAAKERLEPAILRALIKVESNFNHKAVSKVGARGLMQLMPYTAKEIASKKALDQRNPRANIMAGAKYLRAMINKFRGDLRLALAAYNAGPGAVEKYGRRVPPYKETQDYVRKVLSQIDSERKIVYQSLSAGLNP